MALFTKAFGNDAAGGNELHTGGANTKGVTKFTLAADATVHRLSVYIQWPGNPYETSLLRGVVYADNAGEPGALVAVTDPGPSSNFSYSWATFEFASPVDLTAGTYWLGIIANWDAHPRGSNTGGATRYVADTYSDGPSDPFGTTNVTSNAWTYPVYVGTDVAGAHVGKAVAYAVRGVLTLSVAKAVAYAVRSLASGRLSVAKAVAYVVTGAQAYGDVATLETGSAFAGTDARTRFAILSVAPSIGSPLGGDVVRVTVGMVED